MRVCHEEREKNLSACLLFLLQVGTMKKFVLHALEFILNETTISITWALYDEQANQLINFRN